MFHGCVDDIFLLMLDSGLEFFLWESFGSSCWRTMLLWILCPVLLSAHLRVRDTQGPPFLFEILGSESQYHSFGFLHIE